VELDILIKYGLLIACEIKILDGQGRVLQLFAQG
jgi:hypothetical protein